MNLNALHYVIAVAEEKNFTRAARRLYISQPSLSQSIQSLEQQLGAPLFDRTSAPLRLTPAGEEYLAWARQVVDSEAQTRRRISDIVQNKSRHLVVGVSPYRSLHILPEVLSEFYKKTNGECTVTLIEQRSSEYMKSMEEGKLDLLIDRPASDDSPYDTITLAEEQILLAVPARLRLPADDVKPPHSNESLQIKYEETGLSSLHDQPVIMLTEAQHMGRTWRQLFEKLGEKPNIVLECQSIEMAFTMVRQGLGLTLVPESVIRFMPPSDDVLFYVLKDYPLSRTIAVLYPKYRYLSQDARCFIELLKEVLK